MKTKETLAEQHVVAYEKKRADKKSPIGNTRERKWLSVKKGVIGLLAIAFMCAGTMALAPRANQDPAIPDLDKIAACDDKPDTIVKSLCYGTAFTETLLQELKNSEHKGKVYINLTIYKDRVLQFGMRSEEIDLSVDNPNLEPLNQVLTALNTIDTSDPEISLFLYLVQSSPYSPGNNKLYSESYMAAYLPQLNVIGRPLFYSALASSCSIQEANKPAKHYLLYSKLAANYGELGNPKEITITETGSYNPYDRFTYLAGKKHTGDLIKCADQASTLFKSMYVTMIKKQAGK